VISRYFVIALALGVAVMQAINHAWVEAAGLFGLGIGLILLRVAEMRANPLFKKIAWISFVLPIAAMLFLLRRDFLR
jgi:hypothetical protein